MIRQERYVFKNKQQYNNNFYFSIPTWLFMLQILNENKGYN